MVFDRNRNAVDDLAVVVDCSRCNMSQPSPSLTPLNLLCDIIPISEFVFLDTDERYVIRELGEDKLLEGRPTTSIECYHRNGKAAAVL